MNIGILSMQEIPNYGSFLQAFSLKQQFEQRGHNVYFIDIITGRKIRATEEQKTNLFKKIDRYFWKRLANYFFYKRMLRVHKNDCKEYLQSEIHLEQDKRFDLVVIGSDEVFNATIPSKWGFTTQLFGDIKNADKIVTYAASCGSTRYEDAEQFGIVKEIRDAMSNLDHISVRDSNTSDFVKNITGLNPIINVDPVFISSFDKYIPEVKTKKPYMLIYAYGNRINEEKEINAIKSYAKKNNLEIISVGMQQRWCNHNIVANAFELLGYVKNATCIVTDTFHGAVFSIKYNKRFAVLVRESNKNKLEDLLAKFLLRPQIINGEETLDSILSCEIDYETINHIIRTEAGKSYEYIDMVTKV